jgi:hypothetical protein
MVQYDPMKEWGPEQVGDPVNLWVKKKQPKRYKVTSNWVLADKDKNIILNFFAEGGCVMAHEELKKQYEQDKKQYGRDAYKLWEFYKPIEGVWMESGREGPEWRIGTKYRRIEPVFQPQEFSGMNWREAEPMLYKTVEASNNGEEWLKTTLIDLNRNPLYCQKFVTNSGARDYNYIRTCPETFQHPTIKITVNGKDFDLPKPETEATDRGYSYWIFSASKRKADDFTWACDQFDERHLKSGLVHLTEDRAQAWADFWKEIHK